MLDTDIADLLLKCELLEEGAHGERHTVNDGVVGEITEGDGLAVRRHILGNVDRLTEDGIAVLIPEILAVLVLERFQPQSRLVIHVTSLPEGYAYSFSGEDAKAIIDYLSNLNLEENFKENPDGYTGMTWVVSLKYDNGNVSTVYHFGNMFIKVENGPWYLMTYDEASRFGRLLSELND